MDSRPLSLPASIASMISSYLTYFSILKLFSPIPEILKSYAVSPTGTLISSLLSSCLYFKDLFFKSSILSIIFISFYFFFLLIINLNFINNHNLLLQIS